MNKRLSIIVFSALAAMGLLVIPAVTLAVGTGTLDRASGWYPAGTNFVVNATPETNSVFDTWLGDTNGTTIAGAQVSFAVNDTRSITARFTEVIMRSITVTPPSKGTIVPGGVVSVPDGGTTNFVITPDARYYISSVLTNSGPAVIGNSAGFTYVWSNITASGTFAAIFDKIKTNKGVPEEWLDSYGLTNGGYAAAELSDTDADGAPAWKEYHAGTSPTNYFSVFKIVLHPGSLPGGNTNAFQVIHGADDWSLVFLGGTNDDNFPFEIYRCTNLTVGNWLYATNFVRTDGVNGTNTWIDLDASNYWPNLFYRIVAPTN